MKQTRYESGMEMLRRIDGTGGEKVIRSLENIAPDIGRQIIEFAFGDIYTRKTLTLQEREMITIASLLAIGGCEPQLEVHINGSLNVGIIPGKNHRDLYAMHSLHRLSESTERSRHRKESFCRNKGKKSIVQTCAAGLQFLILRI